MFFAQKLYLRLKKGIKADNYKNISTDIKVGKNVFLGNTKIDKNVYIGDYTYIYSGHIYAKSTVGRFCSIGENVSISIPEHPVNTITSYPSIYYEKFIKINKFKELKRKHYYNYVPSKPTIVEDNVWIGSGVIILRGVTIGHSSIIAAGAVITEDVLSYSIVGGVPAKLIKYRHPVDVIQLLNRILIWDKSTKEIIDLMKLGLLDLPNVKELEHVL